MSDVSNRILNLISSKELSYGELNKITNIPKSALQRYATGETEKIPLDRIEILATALGVTAAYLMGWEESPSKSIYDYGNIIPIPKMKSIPLLGTIACGEPILASENIEDYIKCPGNINADYALRCKGDSMINARIFNGDIVFVRQQPDVDDGEIAAVLIDDEATLKRVYHKPNRLRLKPENPTYEELEYEGEELENIRILGKAIYFLSTVR